MTEYDYSTEAYQRYLETQQRIAKWVDHAETKRAHFTNPFVASPRSDLDEEEVRNDFHSQDEQQGHHHHHHHQKHHTSHHRDHRYSRKRSSSPPPSNQTSAKLVPQPIAHAFYPSSQWYLTPQGYASGATTTPALSGLDVSGNNNSSLSLASARPNKLRKASHSPSSHLHNGYTSQSSATTHNATGPSTVVISPPTIPVISSAPAAQSHVYLPTYASQPQYYQHALAQNAYQTTTPAVVPATYPAAIQYQYQAKPFVQRGYTFQTPVRLIPSW